MTGRTHGHDLVFCSRSGPPQPAVARARRQRPPREARRGRGRLGGARRRSGSSPTTWRSSTTSTPRPSRTAERLELDAVRVATLGHRPAVRGDGPRAAARARGRRARGAGRAHRRRRPARVLGRVRRRVLPQPAGTATGAQRGRSERLAGRSGRARSRRRPRRSCATWRWRRPARPASWS